MIVATQLLFGSTIFVLRAMLMIRNQQIIFFLVVGDPAAPLRVWQHNLVFLWSHCFHQQCHQQPWCVLVLLLLHTLCGEEFVAHTKRGGERSMKEVVHQTSEDVLHRQEAIAPSKEECWEVFSASLRARIWDTIDMPKICKKNKTCFSGCAGSMQVFPFAWEPQKSREVTK